eukprot:364795-Chlamydomonas_euryale.AAC.16
MTLAAVVMVHVSAHALVLCLFHAGTIEMPAEAGQARQPTPLPGCHARPPVCHMRLVTSSWGVRSGTHAVAIPL